MSNFEKKIIIIPENVILKTNKKQTLIFVKGKFGIIVKKLFSNFLININENKELSIINTNKCKQTLKFHGLLYTFIKNMIIGVDQKFYKRLIIEGVGYKFQLDNNILLISAGYSYIKKIQIPNNLKILLESSTKLLLSGINKEKLGLFAAKIKNIKMPEPYKGKGIFYEGEIINKKEIIKKKKK